MSRPRKIGVGCIALLLLGIIGGMIWRARSEWIPAGNVGILYNASGGLDRSRVLTPQRVTVGWRQKLYQYPTRLQPAVYTQDPEEGEIKAADGVQVTTNDNQNTIFDIMVIYHIDKNDVFKAFDSFGPIPIEDVQRQHIRRALREAVNNVGTQYNVFELMGAKRQEASQKLTDEMRRLLGYKGITIDLAMLGPCEPTADLQNKINARVNAYTDLQISQIKAQIADYDRQIAVVTAEAQNKARQLSASKTQGSSLEMLQLEATEAAIQRWNGELPQIQSQPGQTIVIGGNGLLGGNLSGGRQ